MKSLLSDMHAGVQHDKEGWQTGYMDVIHAHSFSADVNIVFDTNYGQAFCNFSLNLLTLEVLYYYV